VPVIRIKLVEPNKSTISGLQDALEKWWADQQAAWPKDPRTCPEGEEDLWNDMPEIDSKAVARTTPLFKEHLGVRLDVRLIRHGGYRDLEDMVNDLVPKMVNKIKEKISKKAVA
jgi:hypothetical protein